MNNQFNYHAARARAARFARFVKPRPVQLLMLVVILGLGVGFGALLVLGTALAWLVLIPVPPLVMLMIYTRYELTQIPPGKTDDINDLLSAGVMSQLPKEPTPVDLARVAVRTNSGRFLAVRFGITPALLEQIAEQLQAGAAQTSGAVSTGGAGAGGVSGGAVQAGGAEARAGGGTTGADSGGGAGRASGVAGVTGAAGINSDPTAQILAKSREIQARTQSLLIGGGVIAAALVESLPTHEQVLHQLRLEVEDLEHGITWYNFLYGLVENSKRRQHHGGFARDLMFGYIPLLSRFGVNISQQREHALKTQMYQVAHREIIDKMTQIFSNSGRQNVALIGPAGSGRTTIINAFAEQLLDADSKLPANLKFRQIFMLDSAALIAATGGHGQLENLMMQLLDEAYAAKNIIICLDNAQLFFEEGTGSVDISNVLLPVLENGALRIILTLEQQKYLEIAAKNSTLANALNKIMVSPANQEETMRVMEDRLPQLEYRHHVTYTYLALKEAYRLAERYIYDLEMPGRALNLLESAANFAAGGLVTPESVQTAIEKTGGVKVQVVDSAADRQKLLNLEQLIHARMIDQVDAVKTVSDALRRAAAGVRNQNRPIGTFLFLGPTGVGKTELAKALSEVYFGGESQLVRLDLNEFVNATDVARLIADGAEDAGSLAAQVMKQPFSVVLLDEIEKAHDQVLTVLLQVLDEGVLRDVRNREVSFRDAIIICTSNAGADEIRARIEQGQTLAQFKDEITNGLINSGQFRPEFLNRFDEICVFQPLSKADLMQVVDLILASVNKSLEPQKISVTLEPDAKQLLVEKGYDPRLGARPMRRVVQKSVENLVAQAVLSGAAGSGARLHLTREQVAGELG